MKLIPEKVLTFLKTYTKNFKINDEHLFFYSFHFKVTNKMLRKLERLYFDCNIKTPSIKTKEAINQILKNSQKNKFKMFI